MSSLKSPLARARLTISLLRHRPLGRYRSWFFGSRIRRGRSRFAELSQGKCFSEHFWRRLEWWLRSESWWIPGRYRSRYLPWLDDPVATARGTDTWLDAPVATARGTDT